MSSIDLRWATRHPWRWARHVWWQLSLAALLALNAALVGADIWQPVPLHGWWPALLAITSAMVATSALTLHNRMMQEVCRAVLGSIATWRALTYAALWWLHPAGSTVSVLAATFAAHWAIIVLVALRWDLLTVRAGLEVTVEAGREVCPNGGD